MEKRFNATDVYMSNNFKNSKEFLNKINYLPHNYKELIKSNLENSLSMIQDINTFLYIRSDGKDILSRNKKIGGGNLLSLMGLMTMLGMLSKVYYVLSNGSRVIYDNGKITEADAFDNLVKNYNRDIGFKNVTSENTKKIWKEFRDKLTHYNCLVNGNIARTTIYENLKFDQIFEQPIDGLPFEIATEDDVNFANVDQLLFELPRIKDWIIYELEINKFNEQSIIDLLNWYLIKELIVINEPSN